MALQIVEQSPHHLPFLRVYIRLGEPLRVAAINLENLFGTEYIMVIMDEWEKGWIGHWN